MKISLTNLFLVLLLLISGFFLLNIYEDKRELKIEIAELEKEIRSEKDHSILYDKTKEFIEKSSEAKHKPLLTGNALKEMEAQLEMLETENHTHGASLVDNIEIHNVYAMKTGEDSGESYAIYRIYYGDSATPIQMQQIVTLSINLKWKKDNDEYKVSNYEIHLLEDNLDKYLEEIMSKEENVGIENENE